VNDSLSVSIFPSALVKLFAQQAEIAVPSTPSCCGISLPFKLSYSNGNGLLFKAS
jgi:hypothetical protein